MPMDLESNAAPVNWTRKACLIKEVRCEYDEIIEDDPIESRIVGTSTIVGNY
jgi:hypothetical protein